MKLSSFGSFAVRKKGQRIGRNPKTGIEVPISPRRVMVFKASEILKRAIQSRPANGNEYGRVPRSVRKGRNLRKSVRGANPAQLLQIPEMDEAGRPSFPTDRFGRRVAYGEFRQW